MAGRTADISVSSFKPLSLNEIMMVPLAKQKMEDEFIVSNSEVDGLSADVLGGDKERASGIVDGFKNRASAMSDDVMNHGVSRSDFNKLRAMKKKLQSEFGIDGFTGNAIANKKGASKFMHEMSTKMSTGRNKI